MRIFVWLVRAALFFVLFAFALNNQHESAVRWFFGQEWRAPTVFIVLGAFGLGCVFGVIGMLPSWWRHRRVARRHAEADNAGVPAAQPSMPLDMPITQPPRDGL
jgi:lipopolysaccharide assembly protein A